MKKFTLEDAQKVAQSRGGKCLSAEYINIDAKMSWECEKGHQWETSLYLVKNRGRWCHVCNGYQKLSLNEAHELASLKNGKCLSTEYINANSKMLWECEHGHQWRTTLASIKQQGSWCRECNKLTLKQAQELAKLRNGKCLSIKYINANSKMLWECAKGHHWEAPLRQIKNKGSWCKECLKNTLEEAYELASVKNGKCLSTEYINVNTKMLWECEKGHQWETRLSAIKNGRWCQKCRKLTLKDAQQIAKSRNGKCLSTEYINVDTSMSWECENGHQWNANLDGIKNRGNWCRKCLKNTIDEAQELAKLRNGKCLSIEYVNAKTKMSWECENGHQWETTLHTIKRGSWCRECHYLSLKGNSCFVKKWSLSTAKQLAHEKGGRCLSTEYVTNTKMLWECENGHQWEAKLTSIKDRGTWCRECRKLTLDEAQELARLRNGKCLSTEYVNVDTNMLWECEKGHQWETSLYLVKNNDCWCAECYKLTLEEAQQIAKSRNGLCLSTRYVNLRSVMMWECEKGHQWEARLSNIKFGSWCPECRKCTLEEAQELAKLRNGKCLSTKYINSHTKMSWKCEKEHQWEATLSSVKNASSWCPDCVKKNIQLKLL